MPDQTLKVLAASRAGLIRLVIFYRLIADCLHYVCNVVARTYAGKLSSLYGLLNSLHRRFEKAEVCDIVAIAEAIDSFPAQHHYLPYRLIPCRPLGRSLDQYRPNQHTPKAVRENCL